MAAVYILYSSNLNRFYIGSCLDLKVRLDEHINKIFIDGYTTKSDDWELFFSISDLEYKQAREIEAHIKRMKSKSYIFNLKKYRALTEKLIDKYK